MPSTTMSTKKMKLMSGRRRGPSTTMSTKDKVHVRQETLAVDNDADKEQSTSPALRLAVNDIVDANNKSPAGAGNNKSPSTRMTTMKQVQRILAVDNEVDER